MLSERIKPLTCISYTRLVTKLLNDRFCGTNYRRREVVLLFMDRYVPNCNTVLKHQQH